MPPGVYEEVMKFAESAFKLARQHGRRPHGLEFEVFFWALLHAHHFGQNNPKWKRENAIRTAIHCALTEWDL